MRITSPAQTSPLSEALAWAISLYFAIATIGHIAPYLGDAPGRVIAYVIVATAAAKFMLRLLRLLR